jgi:GT2 family glycosyltransferase
VQHARGQYIKFLFQDDVLAPDCIARMVAMAEAHPKVGLVYSKRAFLYDTLSPKLEDFISYYSDLHRYWADFKVYEGVLSGRTYLKDRQFMNSPKNKIGEPTNVLLRRDCFDTIGYFSEDLQQALDSDYWYRVMTCYDIGFIDAELASFRLHDAQASILNKQRAIPDAHLVYKHYYTYLYRYLHPKNQWKLLKLYHPFFKTLVGLKRLIYGQ